MTEQPPRGRPANDQPRYRRHYISLPADVSDWLMRQPSGERSRIIADALRERMHNDETPQQDAQK